MKAVVLFSGGKDSTFALYKALKAGMKVKCLLSMVPESRESYMFHFPNMDITGLQATAIGIQLLTKTTKGVKEDELNDLLDALATLRGNVDVVVPGAVASSYQKVRVERVAAKLGYRVYTPLWGKDPEELWKQMLKLGFRIMMTGVACDGLGKEWLGRVVDQKAFGELKKLSKKYRFHLSGEGGEFETLVLDGPLFKRRLEILEGHREWEGSSGFYIVDKAKLVDK
jgi:ABC transporter with metal-binding/Fe-S-binding domain ATP-binding protein